MDRYASNHHPRYYTNRISQIMPDGRFVASKEPRFITASRVAVLSYVPGGSVSILGGKQRNELAVAAEDVVVP